MTKQDKKLPLSVHLAELRRRVIDACIFFAITAVLCYTFKEEIFNIFTAPIISTMQRLGIGSELVFTSLTEVFTGAMSIVFTAATIITIPFALVQAWLFLSPALYADERRFALAVLISAPILFIVGVVFCYFLVLPNAFYFLATFLNQADLSAPIILLAKMGEYLELTKSLLAAFGLAFLFPLALAALNKIGVITKSSLKRARKFAIVGIFTVAAILTPPDIASQVLLAIPLLLMYEMAIICAKE